MQGFINSFQSLGTVDGPGVRCVVFMQGCPLRCCYCHNPDTWESNKGQIFSPQELMERVLRFKSYIKDGGVTVSGGEPLMQWKFVSEFFSLCRENNIHTALDTSGMCTFENASKVLEFTDLVICDLKFADEESYFKNTKGDFKMVINFMKLVEKKKIPMWVRHVVVPNLTDSEQEVSEIVKIARVFDNVEKIELLPFRKFCVSKYENMGIEFPLKNVPETSSARILELNKLLSL